MQFTLINSYVKLGGIFSVPYAIEILTRTGTEYIAIFPRAVGRPMVFGGLEAQLLSSFAARGLMIVSIDARGPESFADAIDRAKYSCANIKWFALNPREKYTENSDLVAFVVRAINDCIGDEMAAKLVEVSERELRAYSDMVF